MVENLKKYLNVDFRAKESEKKIGMETFILLFQEYITKSLKAKQCIILIKKRNKYHQHSKKSLQNTCIYTMTC